MCDCDKGMKASPFPVKKSKSKKSKPSMGGIYAAKPKK